MEDDYGDYSANNNIRTKERMVQGFTGAEAEELQRLVVMIKEKVGVSLLPLQSFQWYLGVYLRGGYRIT